VCARLALQNYNSAYGFFGDSDAKAISGLLTNKEIE